jgi:tRNA pseudouridine55 synthase
VVGRLRRSSGEKRVGHGGTLDPAATGVLPIFFGRATVLAEYLSAQGKAYRGTIAFGFASSTDDGEGELTAAPVPPDLDEATVAAALALFVGAIQQEPPAYSAVKVDGERSYRRARQGDGSRPAAREVQLSRAQLLGLDREDGVLVAEVAITCGPGFYVRSLARDLGAALGTAAHLRRLRRTSVGPLDQAGAISLEDAEALGPSISSRVLPATLAVGQMIPVPVLPADEGRLAHGMDVAAPVTETGLAFARGEGDRVLAIGEVAGGRFRPRRLVEVG